MKHLITAAFAVILLACTPASATPPNASDLAIAFTAQGDSVLTKVDYRISGVAADSVVLVYSAPRSVNVRHNKAAGVRTDSAFVIPNPPVAEGDSLTVTVTVTPYWKGKVGRSATASGNYYRAPSATIDSIRIASSVVGVKILPASVTLQSGQKKLFCAYIIYANATIVRASNADPACGLTPAMAPDPTRSSWLRYASWTDRR